MLTRNDSAALEANATRQVLQLPLQPKLEVYTSNISYLVSETRSSGRFETQGSQTVTARMILATMSFCYGPVQFPIGTHLNTVQLGSTFLDVNRDIVEEQNAVFRTELLGLEKLVYRRSLIGSYAHALDLIMVSPSPKAWLDFMLRDVPQLRAEGWLIQIADDLPLRIPSPSSKVVIEIRECADLDRLDVDFGFFVKGQWLELGERLVDMINRCALSEDHSPDMGETVSHDEVPPSLLTGSKGQNLAILFDGLKPMLGLLFEPFASSRRTGNGVVSLSRRSAGDIAMLASIRADVGIVWRGAAAPVRATVAKREDIPC